MEGTLADLCAGWAVGRGALHAGELQKRSEWRRKYNARFFVLTCDELAWFPAPRTNELTCSSWRFTAAPSLGASGAVYGLLGAWTSK